MVTLERNRYSGPASLINCCICRHVYTERLVVLAEGQTVCAHDRIIELSHHKSGSVIYDW